MTQLTLNELSDSIKQLSPTLLIIGDATRLHIISNLLQLDCHGVRVGELTKKTHLSRPAISHHLKLLKNAGIVTMRREGTRNYYALNKDLSTLKKIQQLFTTIIHYTEQYKETNDDK